MIRYEVIGTGSSGNATVVEDKILIDCGLPFNHIEMFVDRIKYVLLTHIHTDHFNKSCIKKLHKEHPSIRFICCSWLVVPLINCGVNQKCIDVLDFGKTYSYELGSLKVSPIALNHNVQNCGWKIRLPSGERMIYATDTNDMNGIKAVGYDLYMIESNYRDEDIKQRIDSKKENGEYAYEYGVLLNHLSEQKALDFLYKNMRDNSMYVLMHGHQERNVTNGTDERTEDSRS